MNLQQRTTLHYAIALLLFTVYGVQVCPFLESLTTVQLVLPIIVAFIVQWLIHTQVMRWIAMQPIQNQVKQQFIIDFLLFLLSGIVLGAFNTVIYEFPLESAAKVLFGMGLLGFMIAAELALFREYTIANELAASQQHLPLKKLALPISQRFSVFASICAFAIVGIIFLVVSKDLAWLVDQGREVPIETAQRYILTEVSFILFTVMAYVLCIIFSYARNLNLFLTNENRVLQLVAAGELDVEVPVTSNDEFGQIACNTNTTIAQLAARTQELNTTRDVSILGLASLAETRDNETGGHILRTQYYVKALAEHLSDHPRYCDYLDTETIDLLYKSAPLHDVGKVGIPDAILLKPGKLTDEEFTIMKEHPMIGSQALLKAEQQLGSNSFLRLAREISETHHEKWDGSGYPRGLVGDDIPLSGRLMALADVYDALISKRVYKPAFSHDKARDIIVEGSGNHFDPDVVEAFLQCEQQFQDIAATHADSCDSES